PYFESTSAASKLLGSFFRPKDARCNNASFGVASCLRNCLDVHYLAWNIVDVNVVPFPKLANSQRLARLDSLLGTILQLFATLSHRSFIRGSHGFNLFVKSVKVSLAFQNACLNNVTEL